MTDPEEIRRYFAEQVNRVTAENRHYFEVALEGISHEIRLLAETVARIDEKFDSKTDALGEKIERTAAETQALIKFSYGELGSPRPGARRETLTARRRASPHVV